MKTKLSIIFWLLSGYFMVIHAQMPDSLSNEVTTVVDSLVETGSKTALKKIPISKDSIPAADSFIPPGADFDSDFDARPNETVTQIDLSNIPISDNAVDEEVEYTSEDSMFFDLKQKQIHLWGDAIVKYQTMTIEAEYMIIDWDNNEITAEGKEVNGEMTGKPKFTEGEQTFDSHRMRYNFKTQKGLIYQAATTQEGMNIIGEKAKYISSIDTFQNDVIYNSAALLTTCQHELPHFGVRSRKQKVVPDKVAIVGPSNVEILGIPTPLVLPFGFFPLKQGRRTGLIFPQNYQQDPVDGFGLEEIGWFFPINEYWNLKLTGDIYFKGTLGVRAATQYRRRYKYNGNLLLGFNRKRTELSDGRAGFNPSWSLRWSHNQDSKAHPYQTFGGSINIQTSNYLSTVSDSYEAVSQRTLSSNLSYRRRFQNGSSMSASFNHSQNTQSRQVRVQFPNFNFQTKTIYPFKRKLKTGDPKEKWYEKVAFRYVGELKNSFNATDTTLFTSETLRDAQYGIRHSITPNMSFTVAKYFNVSPSINYKEVWYLKTVNKTFDPTAVFTVDTIFNADSTEFMLENDTTSYGTVNEEDVFGFEPYRQFSAGISVNTQLFGTLLFKKGFLRGLRHVAKPSISLNFSPDYTNPDWGYFKSVQTDLREEEETEYTIFENGIFDKPSISSTRQMALSYGINNIFEAKTFSKKDSTDKKIKLLQNLSLAGSYNFAADSLKFSEVRISGTTTLFNRMTSLNFGWRFDPYAVDEDFRRINTFHYNKTGKVLRFVEASLRVSTRLTVRQFRDLFQGKESDDNGFGGGNQNSRSAQGGPPNFGQDDRLSNDPLNPEDNVDPPKLEEDILDLLANFSINHNFNLRRNFVNGIDTTRITAHTISLRGSIPISEKWNINVGNFGYDLQAKRSTYPALGISRDLHCWEMGFNWTPQRDSYSFYIRVKPGRLDFINVPYNKGRVGASQFGRQF